MKQSDPENSTPEAMLASLEQLTDEVNCIAKSLFSLAQALEIDRLGRNEMPANDGLLPDVDIEVVRYVIQARRLRAQYFDGELFADPAWDMLLDLFQSELIHLQVSVSSLCIAAAVPTTTALRWINAMTYAGLLQRRPDPHDRRRVFVELSPKASEAMRCYFVGRGKLLPPRVKVSKSPRSPYSSE